MKKYISLLVILALLLTPMKAAFAATSSQPFELQSWPDYLKERRETIAATGSELSLSQLWSDYSEKRRETIAAASSQPQSWSDYSEKRLAIILVGLLLVGGIVLTCCRKSNSNNSEENNIIAQIEEENNIIAQIENEPYRSSTLLPVQFTRNHYYYQQRYESFIPGDCGLFAVRRLLRHAKLLGMEVPDLSNMSNQDLRNRMVDTANKKYPADIDRHKLYRTPGTYLTTEVVKCLLLSLNIPEERIIFKGSDADQDNRIPSCLL